MISRSCLIYTAVDGVICPQLIANIHLNCPTKSWIHTWWRSTFFWQIGFTLIHNFNLLNRYVDWFGTSIYDGWQTCKCKFRRIHKTSELAGKVVAINEDLVYHFTRVCLSPRLYSSRFSIFFHPRVFSWLLPAKESISHVVGFPPPGKWYCVMSLGFCLVPSTAKQRFFVSFRYVTAENGDDICKSVCLLRRAKREGYIFWLFICCQWLGMASPFYRRPLLL